MSMRGKRVLGATLVALLVAGTPAVAMAVSARHHTVSARPATQAQPPHQGRWAGRSEQGLRQVFNVLRTNKGLTVQPWNIEVMATCSVTGDQIQLGFGGPAKPVAKDGSFRIRFYDPFFGTFDFEGQLGHTSGTGTAEAALPGLLKNGDSQSCSSGPVAWTATSPGGASAPSATPKVAYHIQITQSKSGHVSWTVTKG